MGNEYSDKARKSDFTLHESLVLPSRFKERKNMWGTVCEMTRGSRSNLLAGNAPRRLSLFVFPAYSQGAAPVQKRCALLRSN
jgi:hypothetical protein